MKLNADQNESVYATDVKTIDAIIKASYEVVSGEKGAPRQWERDNYLHHPGALYAFNHPVNGTYQDVFMTVEEFQKETDAMTMQTSFYETEINRDVRRFGNVAHVWSTYETRLEKEGPVSRRGINSIQLIFKTGRWFIVSWTFCKETESEKIPATFDKS